MLTGTTVLLTATGRLAALLPTRVHTKEGLNQYLLTDQAPTGILLLLLREAAGTETVIPHLPEAIPHRHLREAILHRQEAASAGVIRVPLTAARLLQAAADHTAADLHIAVVLPPVHILPDRQAVLRDLHPPVVHQEGDRTLYSSEK